jgi:glycosyltransferase involved in cell wall biosynthesis
MKILWMSWKDISNPLAGGAEVITNQLCSQLAANGHDVTLLCSGFTSAEHKQELNGYHVIRVGSRYSVYHNARVHYQKYMRGKFDLVVDEVNTMPFFASRYVTERNILFFHQLCREIWFYQMPQPISTLGYLLEPLYLRWLNKNPVITVSNSTMNDLIKYGFDPKKISIVSEGIDLTPLTEDEFKQQDGGAKFASQKILALGAFREMKQTLHIVKAFEQLKNRLPNATLELAGDTAGKYATEVLAYIEQSSHKESIIVHGRVSFEEKMRLMREASCIAVASIKEGWGLIVTEANSQGTPAAGYNVDGLRDSIRNNETGLLAEKNNPDGLADALFALLTNKDWYLQMRDVAWQWSKQITFKKCYKDFCKAAEIE